MLYDYQLTEKGLPSTGRLNGSVLYNAFDMAEYVSRLNIKQISVFFDLIAQEARDLALQEAEEEAQLQKDYPYSISEATHFASSPDGKEKDGNVYAIVKDKGYKVIAFAKAPIGQLEYSFEALEWELVKPYTWGWPGISPHPTLEEMMDRHYPCSHPHLENLSEWNPSWNAGVGTSPILCSKLARVYTRLLLEGVEEIYAVNYDLELYGNTINSWVSHSVTGIAWIKEGTFHYRGKEDFAVPLHKAENALKHCIKIKATSPLMSR